MRRRDLIKSIVCAATAWPLAARAQESGKLRTIGFSGQSTRSAESEWDYAFTQRLRELGWIEDRTITIEYRWSEGRAERFDRSRLSSSGSTSTSLSPRERHRSSPQSKRHQSSLLCL